MKIKFRLGNINFKIKYKGKPENFRKKNKLYEGMLSGAGLNFLKDIDLSKQYLNLLKLYGSIPSSIMNYYKNSNKMFEEYMNILKANLENYLQIKDVIPASGHDIYNYVARYGLANYQIQTVIKLDGHLDFKKLYKAVRLSIEEQPIFGCKFVENEVPYWKKINILDETPFCSMELSDNPEESVGRFMDIPLDMDNDPMVKLKLICSPEYDTMCIKLNHSCCDGTGTKEYVQLLSQIYSSLDQEFGIFIPKPVKRDRKDQDRMFSKLRIVDPETEWIAGSEITRATWPFPWKQNQSETSRVVVKRLDQGELDKLVEYYKARGATLNDLILTAYYRSMAFTGEAVYEEPMEISVTIDLRRYLPDNKTGAIRNFSGSEFTRLSLIPNETFEETLSRVVPMMKEIKNNRPGLQSAIGLERLEKMPFSETLSYYKMVSQWPCVCPDKCAPVLSNLGYASSSLLKFGRSTVTDYYIVPPNVRAPGILLMLSTYNGIITFIGCYYEGSVEREVIEGLLERILNELRECTESLPPQ